MSTFTGSSLLDCSYWSSLRTNSISACGKWGDVASEVVFSIAEDGSTKVEVMSVVLPVRLEEEYRFSDAAGMLRVSVTVLLPASPSVLRLKVSAQDTMVEVKRDLLVLLVDTP